MKKILFFTAIVFFLSLVVKSQVNDDFSDGDYTQNPQWMGETTKFQISSYSSSTWSIPPRLQLNGLSAADTTYLYTNSHMPDLNSKQWEFWVRLAFNTSVTNNCRIYLASDSSNFEGKLNGYFVMLGDDNNDNFDSISLWKQTGNSVEKLITGQTIYTGASSSYRIKITRDNAGTWSMYANQQGTSDYTFQGSAVETTHNISEYFGFFCKYTSTNKTNFYFDDIYAGDIIIDTIPPEAQNLMAISATQVDVLFSENIETASAENINNYFTTGIGFPATATKDPANNMLVHLVFPAPFIEGVLYSMDISNVRDNNGNTMQQVTKTFVFYRGFAFDILINEIMADPDPPVGLPNYEYLELYNRTQIPINLKNWKLLVGTSVYTIPDVTITADSFFIITNSNNITPFNMYGEVAGLSSFSLSNTGTTIILKNKDDKIIHYVSYTDDWYQNPFKEDGGWSLEQIDAGNPCGEAGNWNASNSINGGTPGTKNSVAGSNSDNTSPVIIRASVNRQEISKVKLYFSEIIDSISVLNTGKYFSDNGLGTPYMINTSDIGYRVISLYFSQNMQENVIYTLTVADSIFDCAGNKILLNQTVRFSIPLFPDSGDLVINEVLFNPKENGVDFVEIYNRSSKVLDFKDMYLASPGNPKNIINDNFLSFPGDYTVFTTNPNIVKIQYIAENPNNFIAMEAFPSFNDDAGEVILATITDTIIDNFSYNEAMHFPLLTSMDGVSLERINFNRPANDATNWHSASETVGFATPSYKNSQYSNIEPEDGNVSIAPEIFSPDNDGYNDVLNIHCKADAPGKMLNIIIYDAKGRLIKYLIKNQLISSESTFTWDGTDDSGRKANIGIYVVYMEIIDMKGSVKQYKKTAVLATKF